VLVATGMIAGYWYYNKPHRSVANEDAIEVGAVELYNAFVANEAKANAAYLNQALRVKGIVNSISTNTEGKQVILLETSDPLFGINCTFDKSYPSLSPGDSVRIVGLCTGYLSDVVLVQCSVNPN
jgi:tRNA_anti-like